MIGLILLINTLELLLILFSANWFYFRPINVIFCQLIYFSESMDKAMDS